MGLLTALGVCTLYLAWPAGELRAAQAGGPDRDKDGIRDVQETVIGCSPLLKDSDGDGFTDLEEFACQSDVNSASSTPGPTDLSAGMIARGENGLLQIYIAIFQSPATAGNLDVRVGRLADSRMASIPNRYIANHNAGEDVVTPHGTVTILDISFSPTMVREGSSTSWFVYAFDKNDHQTKSAAVVDIFNIEGVHTVRVPPTSPPGASMASNIDGSIYRPIPPGGTSTIPPTWTPSEICMRSAVTVAVDNAILTQEVTDAECIPDWDAYCGNNCALTVGSTYQTIDPVVLLGN